jgi:hypothetical protein
MAKIISAAYLLGNERPEWTAEASAFTDYGAVSEWARPYVDLSYTIGLFKGNGYGEFLPRQSATRAEASAVMYRYKEL